MNTKIIRKIVIRTKGSTERGGSHYKAFYLAALRRGVRWHHDQNAEDLKENPGALSRGPMDNETLRRMAAEFYSAGEIAKVLRRTRNAVIGRGNRMGVSFQSQVSRRSEPKVRSPPRVRVRQSRCRTSCASLRMCSPISHLTSSRSHYRSGHDLSA